jgi:hypothetical protein
LPKDGHHRTRREKLPRPRKEGSPPPDVNKTGPNRAETLVEFAVSNGVDQQTVVGWITEAFTNVQLTIFQKKMNAALKQAFEHGGVAEMQALADKVGLGITEATAAP